MKKILLFVICFLLNIANSKAQMYNEPTANIHIIPQAQTATIGKNFEIAIEVQMLSDFHAYWNKNTGDTGISTAIEITSSSPAVETNQDWPHPQKQVIEPFINFGYKDKFYVFSNIFVPNDYKSKSLNITINTSWLACNEKSCIPDSNKQSLNIPVIISEDIGKSEEWLNIEKHKKQIPVTLAEKSEFNINADSIIIELPDSIKLNSDDFFFFPEQSNLIKNNEAQTSYNGSFISIPRDTSLNSDISSLKEMKGVITIQNDGDTLSYNISATYNAQLNIPQSDNNEYKQINLISILLFAFLGGLILNLMPCVLPILSLKILSLKSTNKKTAFKSGVSYFIGVFASFIIFASIIEGLKQGGDVVGWGFQLQHSGFVVFMIYLFFMIGLNLSGYFEFTSIVHSRIQSKEYKNHYIASFMSGILAVAIASPCTAPFMGVALGYTISKSSWINYAVFSALAIGFSLPYVILAIKTNWLSFIPKSGKWSIMVKEFMAFPIYATVIWLLWVLMQQTSVSATIITTSNLLLICFSLWIYKNFSKATAIVIATITISSLSYSSMLANSQKPTKQIYKQDLEIQHLQNLIDNGEPVFISFSASWCITCLVNEKAVLDTNEFRAIMDDKNINYVKIDWTNHDDNITSLLNKYGRNSVPLYIYYPANSREYKTLPPLITINMIKNIINNQK